MERTWMGRVGLAAAMLAALAVPTRAQEPAAQEDPAVPRRAVMKGRAPVASDVLRVRMPRPAEATLANGLRVMVIEDRRAPQVAFELHVPGAGGYFDPADQLGLAQFTASMLREGTATRSSQAVAEQLDRLAASLDVATSAGAAEVSLTAGCLSEHLDTVLGLAAEVLLAPSFPETEMARYKARARATAVQQRTQPTFLVTERFGRVIYGDHPAGRSGAGAEGVEKATREALLAFHRARYVPDHAVIAFIGDVSLAEAVKKTEAAFGGWKKSGVAAPVVVDAPAPAGPSVVLVDRPASVQTVLRVGVAGVRRVDPDFETLSVLNRVVGGPGGRLFRHLREEKGYTYLANSFLVATQRHAGHWVVTTDFRTAVTGPALSDLLDELRQAREVPIPDKELADAKRSLVASQALSLERPSSMLSNAVRGWRLGLPADYWDGYGERIDAITAAQVQAVAKKYLDPSRLQIVAVGDGAAIGHALRKFGELRVYDTEGNLVAGAR